MLVCYVLDYIVELEGLKDQRSSQWHEMGSLRGLPDFASSPPPWGGFNTNQEMLQNPWFIITYYVERPHEIEWSIEIELSVVARLQVQCEHLQGPSIFCGFGLWT